MQVQALEVLQRLGYTCLSPAALQQERDSSREVLLVDRLVAALRRLNPGLSDARVQAALRELTGTDAAAALPPGRRALPLLTRGATARAGARPPRRVRYLDLSEPAGNDYLVTWKLPVRGVRRELVLDLVVFVNGIPLVVLACPPTRSAAGPAWQGEALARLWHAQEAEPAARDLGAPRLFETVQLVAALDAEVAVYGCPGTPPRRFTPWRTPWPRTIGQVASLLGREPTAQDLLLFGMLSPPNLLDLVHSFIAFIEPEPGRGERTLCLGSEYRAVQSAVLAARSGSAPAPLAAAPGGLLWHAGGDSAARQLLMMAWVTRKLRADPRQRDRPVLLITPDPRQADALTRALRATGQPDPARAPAPAPSPDADRALRAGGPPDSAGSTVSAPSPDADRALRAGGPPDSAGSTVSAPAPDLDRAPRGGSRELARQRGGRSRSSEKPAAATVLFTAAELQGPLGARLAPYGAGAVILLAQVLHPQMRELPARLRRELPDACLLGLTAAPVGVGDAAVAAALGPCLAACGFGEAIAEHAALPVYLEARRPELQRAAVPEADRVRALGLDLAAHFRRVVQPGGGQGYLIARCAEAARLYKETLDRLGSPQAALADDVLIAPARTPGEPAAPRSRPDRARPTPELLISCQPPPSDGPAALQVVYVDAPLAAPALLQSVLAVNTPAPDKLFGLLIDYAGLDGPLTSEGPEALCRPEDELPRLQQGRLDALRCLSGVANLYSLEGCLAALHDPEQRGQLHAALHRCARPLELLLDDPRAQDALRELCWLGQVLLAAAARYRDERIGLAACGPRVRQRLAESIARDGHELLVTRTGLASPLLDAKLAALETAEAQAGELAQAIAYEIRQHQDEEPAFFTALRGELERLLSEHRSGRLAAAPLRSKLKDLRQALTGRLGVPPARPLPATAQRIYEVLLADAAPAAAEPALRYGPAPERDLQALAAQLAAHLAPRLAAARPSPRDAAVAELHDTLAQELRAAGYSREHARSLAIQMLARLDLALDPALDPAPDQAT